jgi:hypothetical protein
MPRVVVIYPGGFQPFHKGHLSSYIQAKKNFPDADFYVATSADVKQRPIPYEEKKFLATQAGVDPEDFPNLIVKSPLNPKEILNNYNPEEDIFILVRSERDPVPYTKKDGSLAYYQPFDTLDKAESFGKHGYVFVTKKHDFKINGEDVFSGSQVRNMYQNASDKDRINIIKQLYPNSKRQETIKSILDKYLGMNDNLQELVARIKPLISEATNEQKAKFVQLLEAAKAKMEAANAAQQAAIAISMKKAGKKPKKKTNESVDYLPEK